jgi:hypothetical protein
MSSISVSNAAIDAAIKTSPKTCVFFMIKNIGTKLVKKALNCGPQKPI